ncbi:MAG: TolC family protein [Pseudomonadota bacterium]|nr:TolC family protein [Pseudomonadota bacterium]
MSHARFAAAALCGIALLLALPARAQAVPVSASAQAPAAAVPVPRTADAALPDQALAMRAIQALPEVRRKAAEFDAARARADMRNIGNREAQVTWIPQDRRVQDGTHYREWELDIDKSVRWPSKYLLDKRIGQLGVEAARLDFEDSHHAGARLLLAQWSAWLRAGSDAAVSARIATLIEQERALVARRVHAGDAAQKDLLAADAALAEARASAIEAGLAEQSARRTLAATFPTLPLPQRVPRVENPPALAGAAAQWQARIVDVSHEIGMARSTAEQREVEARRARADRVPDPVLGVRVLSDLGGHEKVYGVILGLPLGFRYRGAQAAEAGAQAQAAAQDLSLVMREVHLSAAQVVSQAEALHALWQQRALAQAAATASLEKTRRAYALGEAGISEVLLAAQGAAKTDQAAGRAAVDTLYAVERVAVDAHARWHRHAEAAHDGADHAADATPAGNASAVKLPALGE